MIYFFHHYELPLILQQAQIRDILARQAAQPAQGGEGAGGAVGVAGGGAPAGPEVRRVARPRMRGFTLGGFRFRFGIVFHSVHQVPQQQVIIETLEPHCITRIENKIKLSLVSSSIEY